MTRATLTHDPDARLRLAETTSSVGAGVLGVGIGVLAAEPLRSVGLAALAIGLALHAWGMADKHRLETSADRPIPRWSTALYWICWLGLAAIAAIAIVELVR